MKKLFPVPAVSRLTIVAFIFTALLFSACSKNDNGDLDQPPTAGLMLFNLSTDKPTVGFTISNNQVGPTLGYTNFSGNYLPIYAASRELRSVDATNGNTITTNTYTFADSTYYSAFLIGGAGYYRHVVVKDNFDPVVPVAGKAWVRYINAVADTTSRPDVTIEGTTEGAIFGTVSDFRQVNAGDVTTSITSGAFTASRTITVAENKIYTVLFVGKPGAADPTLEPMVKFIENGTATN